MANEKNKSNTISDRELLMTRVVNAPRELVFTVWTEPEHVKQWWGPEGFTNTIHEMNATPGGKFLLTMHGPDGTDYPNKIVYHEVIRPEKLSWHHSSGDNDEPGQFTSTVTFEEQGEKTLITMHILFASKEELDMVVKRSGAIEGNRQTMNRLEAYLATLPRTGN